MKVYVCLLVLVCVLEGTLAKKCQQCTHTKWSSKDDKMKKEVENQSHEDKNCEAPSNDDNLKECDIPNEAGKDKDKYKVLCKKTRVDGKGKYKDAEVEVETVARMCDVKYEGDEMDKCDDVEKNKYGGNDMKWDKFEAKECVCVDEGCNGGSHMTACLTSILAAILTSFLQL